NGRRVFMGTSTRAILCSPDEGQTDERLHRSQFGMYRFRWPDEGGAVEFHLAHGHMIDLLRANRFEIERLRRAPGAGRGPHARTLRLRDSRMGTEVAGRR